MFCLLPLEGRVNVCRMTHTDPSTLDFLDIPVRGVLRPLKEIKLREGEKLRVIVEQNREKILGRYAGIIRLGRKVKLRDILELEDEPWLH